MKLPASTTALGHQALWTTTPLSVRSSHMAPERATQVDGAASLRNTARGAALPDTLPEAPRWRCRRKSSIITYRSTQVTITTCGAAAPPFPAGMIVTMWSGTSVAVAGVPSRAGWTCPWHQAWWQTWAGGVGAPWRVCQGCGCPSTRTVCLNLGRSATGGATCHMRRDRLERAARQGGGQ